MLPPEKPPSFLQNLDKLPLNWAEQNQLLLA